MADDDSDAQEKIGLDIGDLIEDSPYLEVRVAVSNTDDPGVRCVELICLAALTLEYTENVDDRTPVHNDGIRDQHATFLAPTEYIH